MAGTDTLDIPALLALDAARTPGELIVDECGGDPALVRPGPNEWPVAWCYGPNGKDNARAISAAVNALGPLLERLEQLEAERAGIEEVLSRKGAFADLVPYVKSIVGEFNRAVDCVDRVFQECTEIPNPILPNFAQLGADKFEAVIALAKAYKSSLERVEELELHVAADDERERMDAEFIGKLQRVLEMTREYIDAPGQVRGELYRELVATVQTAEGLTIHDGATWAKHCERLESQLAAANERIAGLEAENARLQIAASELAVVATSYKKEHDERHA